MKKKLLAGLATGIFLCVMTSSVMATSFTSNGIFVVPTDEDGVVTGSGTNTFTWGTGAYDSDPNRLQFIGGNYSVELLGDQEKMFELGTVNYFNGSVWNGTEVDSTIFFITLSMGSEPDLTFDFEMLLENTPNTGDPVASADSVYLTSTGSEAFFSEGGQNYVLTLGFGEIATNGGLTSFDRFFVEEGMAASTSLIGSLTPAVEPVPEPATMLLFGTGLAGLAGYRNRRKKKA